MINGIAVKYLTLDDPCAIFCQTAYRVIKQSEEKKKFNLVAISDVIHQAIPYLQMICISLIRKFDSVYDIT